MLTHQDVLVDIKEIVEIAIDDRCNSFRFLDRVIHYSKCQEVVIPIDIVGAVMVISAFLDIRLKVFTKESFKLIINEARTLLSLVIDEIFTFDDFDHIFSHRWFNPIDHPWYDPTVRWSPVAHKFLITDEQQYQSTFEIVSVINDMDDVIITQDSASFNRPIYREPPTLSVIRWRKQQTHPDSPIVDCDVHLDQYTQEEIPFEEFNHLVKCNRYLYIDE